MPATSLLKVYHIFFRLWGEKLGWYVYRFTEYEETPAGILEVSRGLSEATPPEHKAQKRSSRRDGTKITPHTQGLCHPFRMIWIYPRNITGGVASLNPRLISDTSFEVWAYIALIYADPFAMLLSMSRYRRVITKHIGKGTYHG